MTVKINNNYITSAIVFYFIKQATLEGWFEAMADAYDARNVSFKIESTFE